MDQTRFFSFNHHSRRQGSTTEHLVGGHVPALVAIKKLSIIKVTNNMPCHAVSDDLIAYFDLLSIRVVHSASVFQNGWTGWGALHVRKVVGLRCA